MSSSEGTFFGAIVALDDENDFPDSGDFSTPDFLGSTLLTFPVLSDEVFGDLSLSLDPGWYALIFGSGLFDTTGGGGAVRNGTDLGSPTYIGFQPGNPGWRNTTRSGSNERFFVNGQIVPEAASEVLASIASLLLLLRNRA
ncbi:MAG: hypothetical protein GXP24_01465 [Planctomycetes bacterium]|nr:hypothetical protein [Planctomycetota bacterium]